MTCPWDTQITEFSTWLKAAGRTPRTIETRVRWLRTLIETTDCTPATITHQEIASWLANPNWKPNSRRNALASARRFFHYLKITGYRKEDPTTLLLPIRVPRAKTRPMPTSIITQALENSPSTEQQLMLLLGAFAGLRRTEIASLHTSNYAQGWLTITGKGGNTRQIPVHPQLAPFLDLKSKGYYFPGRFTGHRSNDNIAKKISHLLGANYTPHSLRHWFATTVYSETQDIRAVQELLGHADITTTQLYIGIEETSLKIAVKTLPSLLTAPAQK